MSDLPPLWFVVGFVGFFLSIHLVGGFLTYLAIKWLVERP